MQDSTHGHDVMKMMLQHGGTFTRASLLATIINTFGQEARFHTCSAENLTADDLIDFLDARGKFITTDAGFNTSEDKICQH